MLTHICVKVRPVDTGVPGLPPRWEYVAGCFRNGDAFKREPAEPGKTYSFNGVFLEVRGVDDPYNVAAENDYYLGAYLGLYRTLCRVFLVLFVLALFAFVAIYCYGYQFARS